MHSLNTSIDEFKTNKEVKMEIQSMGAIRECMSDMGINTNDAPTIELEAKITNLKNNLSGLISITFNCNWHSGDDPYIETDESIKSYGIQYTCFKPKWQQFKYNVKSKELYVSGDGYKFVLIFT